MTKPMSREKLGVALNALRWKKVSQKERSEFMSEVRRKGLVRKQAKKAATKE